MKIESEANLMKMIGLNVNAIVNLFNVGRLEIK
jgi:hypothetical protein